MARPVSEEELQLKKRARRRLIGAIVLVCVVAVVLPMVLDSEPKRSSQEISIQIPSPDKGFVTKVVPLTPPAKSDKGEKGDKGDKAEPKPKPPVMAEAPPTPPADTPPAKIEPPQAKADAPKESAKAEGGAFFVQVVALADVEKARQVQQQIIDAGFKSYTEVLVAGNGNVTRVRAGPFATRDEAEAARKKLVLSGLEGKVGNR